MTFLMTGMHTKMRCKKAQNLIRSSGRLTNVEGKIASGAAVGGRFQHKSRARRVRAHASWVPVIEVYPRFDSGAHERTRRAASHERLPRPRQKAVKIDCEKGLAGRAYVRGTAASQQGARRSHVRDGRRSPGDPSVEASQAVRRG